MQAHDVDGADAADTSFGRCLRRLRKALDLTQADLGQRVGYAAVTIHKLETDQLRPSREMAWRLADELAVAPEQRAAFLRLARDAKHPVPSAAARAIPVALSSFVGRQHELAEVRRLLATARLLTLTGTGGVGKTRLALEAARLVTAEDGPGVCIVELASITEVSAVAQAVATKLGPAEPTGRPPLTTVIDMLRQQKLLLVLDNCEQVVQGCAELADAILRACPAVRILATSRQRLGILGETTWRVPSMALPTADTSVDALQACDAARLFVERAVALAPEFALSARNAAGVTRVCRQLEGIPLAIELAAARINVLSVDEIAARLHDSIRLLSTGNWTASPRQQTLRATFDWSYRLLDHAERTLLTRLAVFAGGWTLEAAEAVCADAVIAASDVLDVLARLVEKSLVLAEAAEAGGVRYRLHEPLRQFLDEPLVAEDTENSIRRQHAHWYMQLAEQAAKDYHGPKQAVQLRQLEREHANVRAALRWLDEAEELDQLDRLAVALWWFWLRRNHLEEGRAWLERLLARAAPGRAEVCRATLLMQAGSIAWLQGDFAAGQRWADESLGIARQQADIGATAYALGLGGRLAVVRGDFAAARAVFQESLELTHRVGDAWWEGRVREGLATVALQHGDFAAAASQLEHAIGLARTMGDEWSLATLLTGLGDVARARGNYQHAGHLYRESIALHQRLGTEPAPTLRHNLAYVALHQGDLRGAARLFGESLQLFRSYAERRGMAECLVGLAGVAAGSGDRSRAARLLGAAEAAFESLGAQISPSNRADFSRIVALARTGASPAKFAAAWTAGHGVGTAVAVEEALALSVDAPPAVDARLQAGPLTPRETQVAVLISRGDTNREIARTLVISEGTVERHAANIFRKLGCRSRAQVATWATGQGLLSPTY
ncbi:MAG TPA: LuxR C-terminal-related transcriptional regulator [Ktedonobacterales bacterium]|nr:LuxR C-terminal-related transcriptional regulator [Ktedonobacterales bacterium]